MNNSNNPNQFDPKQGGSPFKQDNPYASPIAPTGFSNQSFDGRKLGPGNLVRQVPVVGSLMIVQGILVALVGGSLAVFSLFLVDMINDAPGPGMPSEQAFFLQLGYGIFGSLLLAIGVLNIYSGIRLIGYRGRMLAFLALSTGLMTLFSCYCAPTAIGLAVYGFIVLLNGPTMTAFKLRRDGMKKEDVLSNFY